MRKKIIEEIREDLERETPELDLRAILEAAEIREEIEMQEKINSGPKWILRPFFAFSATLLLFFVLMLLFPKTDEKMIPEGKNSEIPPYLIPAYSLYLLSEEREIESEDNPEIYLSSAVLFLDRYLESVVANYYRPPEFDIAKAKKGYHETWKSGNVVVSSKKTMKDDLTEYAIEIDDGEIVYSLNGHFDGKALYLELSLPDGKITEIFQNQTCEIKIYQNDVLSSSAIISETENGIMLENELSKNTQVIYLINKQNNQFTISYYLLSKDKIIGENGLDITGINEEGIIIANKTNGLIIYEVNLSGKTFIFYANK